MFSDCLMATAAIQPKLSSCDTKVTLNWLKVETEMFPTNFGVYFGNSVPTIVYSVSKLGTNSAISSLLVFKCAARSTGFMYTSDVGVGKICK